jgi:hypothetical protein
MSGVSIRQRRLRTLKVTRVFSEPEKSRPVLDKIGFRSKLHNRQDALLVLSVDHLAIISIPAGDEEERSYDGVVSTDAASNVAEKWLTLNQVSIGR